MKVSTAIPSTAVWAAPLVLGLSFVGSTGCSSVDGAPPTGAAPTVDLDGDGVPDAPAPMGTDLDGDGVADPVPPGTAPPTDVVAMPPPGVDPALLNPGYIQLHRLSNTEYNNTVRDLLGTSLRPADFFQAATVTGFDTNAQALAGVGTPVVQAYFDAAQDLVADVFTNPALKANLVTCQPAAVGDTACAQSIIETFGRRAWRRPLDAAEVQAMVGSYTDALSTLGKDHEGGIAHVVRIFLTSAPLLYQFEIDPDPQAASTANRPLNGFELASRLSYAIWGSMPDDALLDLAQAGGLADPATLVAQVDRMLDDPKGAAFLDNFLDQWLGLRQLASHQVDAAAYPQWTPDLRQVMLDDAHGFFAGFVSGGQGWTQVLSAPVDTTNAALASLYTQDPPGGRAGFLGLPAFLTATSLAERTAPTYRGKVVLESLLCTHIEPPANLQIPDLEEAGGDQVDPTNIREKLELHRQSPACAGCHAILDPIGLGLENFDAIGRYRTAYESGQPVDPSGELQGQAFANAAELMAILQADPRLLTCPTEQLTSFVLGRTLRAEDAPYVEQIGTQWNAGTLRDLVKYLVTSDVFRFRRLPATVL